MPDPVDPMIATVSPGRASNVMSLRTGTSAPGYVNSTFRKATAAGSGKSVTPFSGRVIDDSASSTSVTRSAETAARGIIIAMKLDMMTPIMIWPMYCMNAKIVPISALPALISTPPNHTTATMVTLSTSMNSGNISTNSEPMLRPSTIRSVLTVRNRRSSIRSRTKARTTRTPVSCSRMMRLTSSSLA